MIIKHSVSLQIIKIPNLVLLLSGLLLYLIFLSGCNSNPTVSELSNPADVPEKQIELFDSEIFDYKLGLSLRRQLVSVEVKVIAPFNANDIPHRIEKWLSAVKEYGGEVSLQVDPDIRATKKGLISELIDLIIVAYASSKKALLYKAASNYDATVFYNVNDGSITRVIFDLQKNHQ